MNMVLPSLHVPSWRIGLRFFLLLILYILLGHLGLLMVTEVKNVSPVWPATGFALAILLLWGWRYFPLIALGAFVFNYMTELSFLSTLGLSLANTAEALTGYGLLMALGFKRTFERQADILIFFLCGGVLCTMVGATVGVTSLYFTGVVMGSYYWTSWFTWWSGDMLGALIVTPTLLSWMTIRERHLRLRDVLEMAGILIVIALISNVVFFDVFIWQKAYTPLVFVFCPVLIWLGIRQGLPGVTSGLLVLCAIATSATYHYTGPFSGSNLTEDLMALQAFMGLMTMTALLLTVIENERKGAEQQMKESLHEKEILLKEIHHRVKNNLQIISSLLSMQARFQQNSELKDLVAESQARIQSMSLIHETFYQQNRLRHIDFMDYVTQLTHALQHLYGMGHIAFEMEMESVFFKLDTAIPCGLIINELLSNCFKYAFPAGHTGKIWISLRLQANQYQLKIKDNGIGFQILPKEKTLGLHLVRSLVRQLEGDIHIDSSPGQGTLFQIHFPLYALEPGSVALDAHH